jgi:GAF domain-containing protein
MPLPGSDVETALLKAEQYSGLCDALMRVVIPIGTALFYERDFNSLLERVLVEAKALTRAEGGTLYLVRGDRLEFIMVHNDVLKIAMGGTKGVSPPFDALPLRDPLTNEPNHHNIATHVALTGDSINIADAYTAEGFDFSGTRAFDAKTGYRSKSFMAVPLKNTAHDVIGVLQLINARDRSTRRVIPFDALLERAVASLGLIAAAALEQHLREQRLRDTIQELRVEIDQAKRERQVREITDSNHFRGLQVKLQLLRQRSRPPVPSQAGAAWRG